MGAEQVPATELAARLAEQRAVVDVHRQDTLARRRAEARHRDDLADVDADTTTRARRRAEAAHDEAAQADLADLYRRATADGERARIRAGIHRSAEMRALRVAAVRRATLWIGLPVLAGFAAWSTTGVQAGAVRLLGLEAGSPGWWSAWGVEPALIAIVAGIIIVRAVLRMSGGDVDRRATVAEWTALSVSIALNLLGGWNGSGGVSAAGEALAHSIGALGAAGTAWLIGLMVDYASKAKPWEGADRLADMGLRMPAVAVAPIEQVARGPEPVGVDDLTAIMDATAPTLDERISAAVGRHVADIPAVTPGPARTPHRPRWRHHDVPRSRRLATSRPPQVTVVVSPPEPGHSDIASDTKPARKTAAKTRTTAERVAAAVAKQPDISADILATRLKVSRRTVERHRAAAGVAVNGHNHTTEADK